MTPEQLNEARAVERVASKLRLLARDLGKEYGLGVMDDVLVALKDAARDLDALAPTILQEHPNG